MSLVSVIVPLLNRKKFLTQLFATLQNQLFQDFEVILVDDGSTYNTEKWIKDNQKTLTNNISYVYQGNAGPYSARNNGLSIAKSKYIAFQDSDDEWPDYHLKDFVEILEKNTDTDWLFGSLCRADHQSGATVEKSNFIDKKRQAHPHITLQDEARAEFHVIKDQLAGSTATRHCVPGSTQCALIRSELFKKHLFYGSYHTAYDRFFAIKLVLLGYIFSFVTKTHQIYHIHDAHISLVAGASDEKCIASAKTMQRGYAKMSQYAQTPLVKNAIKARLSEVYAWDL
jgi:glycosyltransferase involved in cell wall biosynthesis